MCYGGETELATRWGCGRQAVMDVPFQLVPPLSRPLRLWWMTDGSWGVAAVVKTAKCVSHRYKELKGYAPGGKEHQPQVVQCRTAQIHVIKFGGFEERDFQFFWRDSWEGIRVARKTYISLLLLWVTFHSPRWIEIRHIEGSAPIWAKYCEKKNTGAVRVIQLIHKWGVELILPTETASLYRCSGHMITRPGGKYDTSDRKRYIYNVGGIINSDLISPHSTKDDIRPNTPSNDLVQRAELCRLV